MRGVFGTLPNVEMKSVFKHSEDLWTFGSFGNIGLSAGHPIVGKNKTSKCGNIQRQTFRRPSDIRKFALYNSPNFSIFL